MRFAARWLNTSFAVAIFAISVYRAATLALTIDEASTYVGYVHLGWNGIFHGPFDANNHILYSILEKFSRQWFGMSELSLRLPALLGAGLFLWSLARLAAGIKIEDYRTKPALVRLFDREPAPLAARDPPVRFRKSVPTAWLELTISEGRNRQIRHMTAAVGHPTLRLIRVAIGDLTLGNLKPGEWRELTIDERMRLEAEFRGRRS